MYVVVTQKFQLYSRKRDPHFCMRRQRKKVNHVSVYAISLMMEGNLMKMLSRMKGPSGPINREHETQRDRC